MCGSRSSCSQLLDAMSECDIDFWMETTSFGAVIAMSHDLMGHDLVDKGDYDRTYRPDAL